MPFAHPSLPDAPLSVGDRVVLWTGWVNGGLFAVAGLAALATSGLERFLPMGIGGGLVAFGLAHLVYAAGQGREARYLAAVQAHGERVPAEVVAAEPTGLRINKRRVVALELRLPDGRRVLTRATVPGRPAGCVAPGEHVRVALDPADLDRVVVVGGPDD